MLMERLGFVCVLGFGARIAVVAMLVVAEAHGVRASSRGRPIVGGRRRAEEGDCRICAWARAVGGDGAGELGGGFSHESEHDLAVMVSEFLESNGSSGTESRYSSDSDSGFSDLSNLADRVQSIQHSMDKKETDLSSAVQSLLLSFSDMDLYLFKDGQCNSSCMRQLLVKGLRVLGYDAAVCASRWQGFAKIPGGDHEYIDVQFGDSAAVLERVIIDIDFHSHFEIARAVRSYNAILRSLPPVYVGSLSRLKEFLQIMVEAAKSSLKQNSMPLPPWRSLAYLQAKWQSKYEREIHREDLDNSSSVSCVHTQCIEHLRRLRALLQSEIEGEPLVKPPIMDEKKRRVKLGRPRPSLLSS